MDQEFENIKKEADEGKISNDNFIDFLLAYVDYLKRIDANPAHNNGPIVKIRQQESNIPKELRPDYVSEGQG